MKYQPIIGLEVHVELATKSKMFCGCSADHFAKKANTQVCPVCLGLPGALPYASNKAIEDTIKFGMALGCKISHFSKFDRKHYFYPDLPKAYQISQYDKPLCLGGEWSMSDGRTIGITRVHLEEDTGKLVHQKVNGKRISLIDFNRSGVPLMELVTEPDFENTQQVLEFLKYIQLVVRYLGISSADMEKGSMRLEANISLMKVKALKSKKDKMIQLPDYKVELKNINSFKFLEKAVNAELDRQIKLLEKGKNIVQETRGYDENTDKTYSQRSKEEAQDYRYFPEPDIPPLRFTKSYLEKVKKTLPELPYKRLEKLVTKLKVRKSYAQILIQDKGRVDYFEKAIELGQKYNVNASTIADLVINQNLDKDYPEAAGLIKKIVEITQKEYAGDKETENASKSVIKNNKNAIEDYRHGKVEVLGYLIGMVQKELKGKGNPKNIREKLLKLLRKT